MEMFGAGTFTDSCKLLIALAISANPAFVIFAEFVLFPTALSALDPGLASARLRIASVMP